MQSYVIYLYVVINIWLRDKFKAIVYGELINKLDSICDKLDVDAQIISKMEVELLDIKRERDIYKNLVIAVGNTIPDLMWAKDLEGRYIYANQEICDVLFYGVAKSAVLGRNDLELTVICKAKVGAENHTFGEICKNSDQVVLDSKTKGLFLEYGLVDGKDVYLEVHKAPFYNSDGTMFGTVGTGRNVTETYTRLRKAITTCGAGCTEVLLKELDRYKFE